MAINPPITDVSAARKEERRPTSAGNCQLDPAFQEAARTRARRETAVWMPSRRICLLLVFFAFLLVPVADYVWKALDNFHEVLPGRVYRSGQLSPSELEVHARLNGIRTVINLRGPNPDQRWYREEVAAARLNGLIHIDLPIDSVFPTNDELAELAKVIEACPKPVLVHCQSGIDRTGIAAAVACLLLDDSSSPEIALEQLGWQFGSMPWRERRVAKRDFLLAYDAWLLDQQFTHSRVHFHTWLQQATKIEGPAVKPHFVRRCRQYAAEQMAGN